MNLPIDESAHRYHLPQTKTRRILPILFSIILLESPCPFVRSSVTFFTPSDVLDASGVSNASNVSNISNTSVRRGHTNHIFSNSSKFELTEATYEHMYLPKSFPKDFLFEAQVSGALSFRRSKLSQAFPSALLKSFILWSYVPLENLRSSECYDAPLSIRPLEHRTPPPSFGETRFCFLFSK